jgi:hypothetical protein
MSLYGAAALSFSPNHGVNDMAARKKTAKKRAKPARKAPAKKSKAASKTSSKAAKAPAKKAKKAPARKKQVVGEGDYAASKRFLKDEASFVKKNKAKIPAMAKAAEKALEGPEGDALREAEAAALARSRDTF